jgi:hypothetical protein
MKICVEQGKFHSQPSPPIPVTAAPASTLVEAPDPAAAAAPTAPAVLETVAATILVATKPAITSANGGSSSYISVATAFPATAATESAEAPATATSATPSVSR